MLSNSRLLSDLWLSTPEPLKQLIEKLTLTDVALLGIGIGLCLALFSLGLLLRFYQAKTRLLQNIRQTSSPLDLSHHDTIRDAYRQEIEGLHPNPDELMRPLCPSLPFTGISKGLLARSYRHAFLVVQQVCTCAVYLQALTALIVLYTEAYRQGQRPTGPTPSAVLDTIHKLAQELQVPLMALRQLDEPVLWRCDEDIPTAIRHFDAEAFLQDAIRAETVLLTHHKVSV